MNAYQRREPEKEVLYQAVALNLETFLERLQAEGHELPKYVVRRRPSGYGEMFDFEDPRSRRSLGEGGCAVCM